MRISPETNGQSLVEFALTVPLLFLLVVNTVNFGSFLFAWVTVANAARAGAQYWVLGSASVSNPTPATAAQVRTLVTNDVSSLLNRASVTVRVCTNNNSTVTCSGSGSATPPADPEPLSFLSALVDVTYSFSPPIPLFSFGGMNISLTLPPTTIHRQAVMRVLQ
jgi:Flp pilus assembly protein TadG